MRAFSLSVILFLGGCSQFREREIRNVRVISNCAGNVLEITLDKEAGTDTAEIKHPMK